MATSSIFEKKNAELSCLDRTDKLPFKSPNDLTIKDGEPVSFTYNEKFKKLVENDLYNEQLVYNVKHSVNVPGPLVTGLSSLVINSKDNLKFALTATKEPFTQIVRKKIQDLNDTLSCVKDLSSYFIHFITSDGRKYIAGTNHGLFSAEELEGPWDRISDKEEFIQSFPSYDCRCCLINNYQGSFGNQLDRYSYFLGTDKGLFGLDNSTDYNYWHKIASSRIGTLKINTLAIDKVEKKVLIGADTGIYYVKEDDDADKEKRGFGYKVNDIEFLENNDLISKKQNVLIGTSDGIKQSTTEYFPKNLTQLSAFASGTTINDIEIILDTGTKDVLIATTNGLYELKIDNGEKTLELFTDTANKNITEVAVDSNHYYAYYIENKKLFGIDIRSKTSTSFDISNVTANHVERFNNLIVFSGETRLYWFAGIDVINTIDVVGSDQKINALNKTDKYLYVSTTNGVYIYTFGTTSGIFISTILQGKNIIFMKRINDNILIIQDSTYKVYYYNLTDDSGNDVDITGIVDEQLTDLVLLNHSLLLIGSSKTFATAFNSWPYTINDLFKVATSYTTSEDPETGQIIYHYTYLSDAIKSIATVSTLGEDYLAIATASNIYFTENPFTGNSYSKVIEDENSIVRVIVKLNYNSQRGVEDLSNIKKIYNVGKNYLAVITSNKLILLGEKSSKVLDNDISYNDYDVESSPVTKLSTLNNRDFILDSNGDIFAFIGDDRYKYSDTYIGYEAAVEAAEAADEYASELEEIAEQEGATDAQKQAAINARNAANEAAEYANSLANIPSFKLANDLYPLSVRINGINCKKASLLSDNILIGAKGELSAGSKIFYGENFENSVSLNDDRKIKSIIPFISRSESKMNGTVFIGSEGSTATDGKVEVAIEEKTIADIKEENYLFNNDIRQKIKNTYTDDQQNDHIDLVYLTNAGLKYVKLENDKAAISTYTNIFNNCFANETGILKLIPDENILLSGSTESVDFLKEFEIEAIGGVDETPITYFPVYKNYSTIHSFYDPEYHYSSFDIDDNGFYLDSINYDNLSILSVTTEIPTTNVYEKITDNLSVYNLIDDVPASYQEKNSNFGTILNCTVDKKLLSTKKLTFISRIELSEVTEGYQFSERIVIEGIIGKIVITNNISFINDSIIIAGGSEDLSIEGFFDNDKKTITLLHSFKINDIITSNISVNVSINSGDTSKISKTVGCIYPLVYETNNCINFYPINISYRSLKINTFGQDEEGIHIIDDVNKLAFFNGQKLFNSDIDGIQISINSELCFIFSLVKADSSDSYILKGRGSLLAIPNVTADEYLNRIDFDYNPNGNIQKLGHSNNFIYVRKGNAVFAIDISKPANVIQLTSFDVSDFCTSPNGILLLSGSGNDKTGAFVSENNLLLNTSSTYSVTDDDKLWYSTNTLLKIISVSYNEEDNLFGIRSNTNTIYSLDIKDAGTFELNIEFINIPFESDDDLVDLVRQNNFYDNEIILLSKKHAFRNSTNAINFDGMIPIVSGQKLISLFGARHFKTNDFIETPQNEVIFYATSGSNGDALRYFYYDPSNVTRDTIASAISENNKVLLTFASGTLKDAYPIYNEDDTIQICVITTTGISIYKPLNIFDPLPFFNGEANAEEFIEGKEFFGKPSGITLNRLARDFSSPIIATSKGLYVIDEFSALSPIDSYDLAGSYKDATHSWVSNSGPNHIIITSTSAPYIQFFSYSGIDGNLVKTFTRNTSDNIGRASFIYDLGKTSGKLLLSKTDGDATNENNLFTVSGLDGMNPGISSTKSNIKLSNGKYITCGTVGYLNDENRWLYGANNGIYRKLDSQSLIEAQVDPNTRKNIPEMPGKNISDIGLIYKSTVLRDHPVSGFMYISADYIGDIHDDYFRRFWLKTHGSEFNAEDLQPDISAIANFNLETESQVRRLINYRTSEILINDGTTLSVYEYEHGGLYNVDMSDLDTFNASNKFIIPLQTNEDSIIIGSGRSLLSCNGFNLKRSFREPTDEYKLLRQKFKQQEVFDIYRVNDTNFLIGSSIGAYSDINNRMCIRLEAFDTHSVLSNDTRHITSVLVDAANGGDLKYLIPNKDNLYGSINKVTTTTDLIALPRNIQINYIYTESYARYGICTNHGLYLTREAYGLDDMLNKYPVLTVKEMTNDALNPYIQKHIDSYHDGDNRTAQFLRDLNGKCSVSAVVFPESYTRVSTANFYNAIKTIETDIIETVEYDDTNHYIKASVSNWVTENLGGYRVYSDEGYVDQFTDPNDGRTYNLAEIPYIVKNWKSGMKEFFIYVPTTLTYYINNPLGYTNCMYSGESIVRKNVSDSFVCTNSVPNNYTELKLILNNNHFNLKNISSIIINGNSLPLKIYKDATYCQKGRENVFDSVIQPSVVTTLPQVETENVNNIDKLLTETGNIVLTFAVYGSDAQSIRIIAE